MTPYPTIAGHIELRHLTALKNARFILDGLPDPDETCLDAPRIYFDNGQSRRFWTCHALARFLKTVGSPGVTWRVIDGTCGSASVEHSWLFSPSPDRSGVILDVLPVAGASGPFLVVYTHHVRGFYREDSMRYETERLAYFDREADQAMRLWSGR